MALAPMPQEPVLMVAPIDTTGTEEGESEVPGSDGLMLMLAPPLSVYGILVLIVGRPSAVFVEEV